MALDRAANSAGGSSCRRLEWATGRFVSAIASFHRSVERWITKSSRIWKCVAERVQVAKKGMNSLAVRPHSIVLMSLRRDAPYADRIEDEGKTLVYEGHNAPKNTVDGDPRDFDQPEFTPSGSPTENGLFLRNAREAKSGEKPPRLVRVYEKLKKGVWSYNGEFLLTDAWPESDGRRQVFKYRLEHQSFAESEVVREAEFEQNRIIPTGVKVEVYKRDRGECVKCGAKDGLHFDHVLAYSRGGSSVTAENIQLLCARHNLRKGARIE